MSTPGPASSLRARAEQALAVPLQHALGASLLDADDPAAGVCSEGHRPVPERRGALHSAALDTIIELGGYLAVLPTLAETEHAITHAIATQLITGAVEGEQVTVRGTLERRTGRLAFVSVVATAGERLIARAQVTKSLAQRR